MKTLCDRVSICIIVAVLGVTLAVYSSLPPQIPMHWNFRGEVDRYGDKTVAAFLLPGLMIGLAVFFRVIPVGKRTPSAPNPNTAILSYIGVLNAALLGLLQCLTLAVALGYRVDLPRILVASLFVMFALMGVVMGRIRRNPWMGIKVPWTLESDRVWDSTHRLAGWTFGLSGVLGMILVLVNVPMEWTPLPIATAVVIPLVYSFLIRDRPGRELPGDALDVSEG